MRPIPAPPGRHAALATARPAVVASVSDRAGYPIGFGQFFRYGSVVVLASLVVSTGYLWVRYLS